MQRSQNGFSLFVLSRLSVLCLLALSGYAFTLQITEKHYKNILPTYQHFNSSQGLDNRFYSPQKFPNITLNNWGKNVVDTPPVKSQLPVRPDTTIAPNAVLPGAVIDTPPVRRSQDTIRVATIDSFDLRISPDTLSGPVKYFASDSLVFDVPANKGYLYGQESQVAYLGNELTAPHIEYDQNTGLVKAHLVKDSAGNIVSMPFFVQDDIKSQMDTVVFNIRTGKGITKGAYTQQGEMFVYGERIKKASPEVFYVQNARFTTCNLDTPHFAFVSNKIKLVNQKMAYSGPVHPEFEGVPVPIVLPFGIYPLQQGRHSGLIAPSFETNQQMGLSLNGLGYYKIINPYLDFITTGSLYSYGSWNLQLNPRYFKRYRYEGNLRISIQNTKLLDQFPSKTFQVGWSHSMNAKARPGVTFTASVNAGSSGFNRNVPNRPMQNISNQMNSSINFAKVWKDRPYNISIGATHDQNTLTQQINLNLPTVGFNLNTIYPFRQKEASGDLKWYENFGIGLNSQARSFTTFSDSAGSNVPKQIMDNFRWGARHSVPITLALPSLGPLQVMPSVSYEERWYQTRELRYWDAPSQKFDTLRRDGFYTARSMSFGLSLSTRIFGMFTFSPRLPVRYIRHEIRPSISMNYTPNLNNGSFYTYRDSTGYLADYEFAYGSGLYGAMSYGKFGGISFNLGNNLQMKVRSKTDTADGGLRKVSLLDNLDFSTAYNFLADSFRLSPIRMSASTQILDKISITGSATLDPYRWNETNTRRIDQFYFRQTPLRPGRLSNASIAVQTSFKGGEKKSDRGLTPENNGLLNPVDAYGRPLNEYEMEAAYINNNPGLYADFSIPWNISASYSFNYNTYRPGIRTVNQDVNLNASMNLTPKWKIGGNGFYSLSRGEIGTISMYITRELHCWQMSMNVSPVGRFRFFNISISPRSPILRDLKVNRTRSYIDY